MKIKYQSEQEFDDYIRHNKHKRSRPGYWLWFYCGKTKFIPFKNMNDTREQLDDIKRKYGAQLQLVVPGIYFH